MIRTTDEPTAVVLDVDQAELALTPTRTRVWAPIGVPWLVETPGSNQKQPLFGAVNSRTGQTHFVRRPHKRRADFHAFVDQVLIPAYPAADFLFLIVDGSSIYTSQSTRQWLAQPPHNRLGPSVGLRTRAEFAGTDLAANASGDHAQPLLRHGVSTDRRDRVVLRTGGHVASGGAAAHRAGVP